MNYYDFLDFLDFKIRNKDLNTIQSLDKEIFEPHILIYASEKSVYYNCPEITDYLLSIDHHNLINKQAIILGAIKANQYEIVKMILEKYFLDPQILKAAISEIVKFKQKDGLLALIETGKLPQLILDHALIEAIFWGHDEIVLLMLKMGANAAARDDYPIILASKLGRLEIIRDLIRKGADVHVKGDLPVRKAAYNGYMKLVKLLIYYGADVTCISFSALKKQCGHRDSIISYVEKAINRPRLVKRYRYPPVWSDRRRKCEQLIDAEN